MRLILNRVAGQTKLQHSTPLTMQLNECIQQVGLAIIIFSEAGNTYEMP